MDIELSPAARALKEELTCCVCLEVILPPIKACSNAHNMCVTCKDTLARHCRHECSNPECELNTFQCPICRVRMDRRNMDRNTGLEERAIACSELVIACAHAPECTALLSYKEMGTHVKTCTHAKKPVPIEIDSDESSDDDAERMQLRADLLALLRTGLDALNGIIQLEPTAPPLAERFRVIVQQRPLRRNPVRAVAERRIARDAVPYRQAPDSDESSD